MAPKRTVLVAHGDPDLLIVIEHFLEDAGFDTTTTWDGTEAMSLIESQHFDAAVVGGPPRPVSCTELLKQLRLTCADTACILLTDSDRTDDGDLRCIGIRAIISKWNLRELVDTLRGITSALGGSVVSGVRGDVA